MSQCHSVSGDSDRTPVDDHDGDERHGVLWDDGLPPRAPSSHQLPYLVASSVNIFITAFE